MLRRVLLLALSLVAACSETPITFSDASRLDAADIADGAGPDGACAAGQWVCDGTRARRCDGRGGYAETRDCAPSGSVCAVGRGCVACLPDNTRCSAANVPQRCAADGARWVDQTACDTAGGFRCVTGRCVRPCDNLGSTYLGCEYWPTVTANGALPEEFEFAVAVSNTQAYPITVTIEGGTLPAPLTRTVAANGLETVVLPWVAPLSGGGMHCCTGVFDTQPNCLARSNRVIGGAYHLRSDGPVAVYQFNPLQFRAGSRFSYSNDASLLLPQNVLGREYLVMSWANTGPPFGTPADRCIATGLRGGFVAIVNSAAARNHVVVRTTAPVFAPGDPARVLPAGELAFDLNPGEALQLLSHGVDLTRAVDLTGTSVRADLPVAVYSGHECANVPNERIACDHLEEQLFPLETWGRRYAVSPFRYRGSDEPSVIRIMAQRDGATLTFDGIATPTACARTLMRGQFCELETATPFQVTGSVPVLVAQYMRGLGEDKRCRCGGGVCVDAPECEGDPAMVLEAPVDQYRTDYRFLVPASYANNYLSVVAPMGADLDLDGRPLVGAVTRPIGAGLVVHQLAVPAGVHDLRAADGQTRFGIKVYGVAPYTSYAYPGGLDLAPISPP